MAETKLSDELLKVIENDLPAQVGHTLKRRLERLDVLEKENQGQAGRIARLDKTVAERGAEIETLRSSLQRVGDLDTREAAVSKRERDLEVEVLKVKLQEAEKRGSFAEQLLNGLVRNTTFREKAYGDMPVAVTPYSGAQFQEIRNSPRSETRETTPE